MPWRYIVCAPRALLRSRDRDTLNVGDAGDPGWNPLGYASAEGFLHCLPEGFNAYRENMKAKGASGRRFMLALLAVSLLRPKTAGCRRDLTARPRREFILS